MPKFSYIAKKIDGQIKEGMSEARDVKGLARELREEGLFLAAAEDVENKKKSFGINIFPKKVSIAEKMFMARNLAIIVSTGLPIVKGFLILSAQAKSKAMRAALLDIGQEIGKGKSMSDSFKKYPNIFSELFQSMIKAGEESGTLENVLKVLALQLEKEKEMNSKVQRALIYPTILISLMLVIGMGLAVFVLPKINKFFSSLNAELPITTKMILGSGDFFMRYWYIVLVLIFIFVFIALALVKTKQGKIIIDTFLLRTPYISSLVKEVNAAALIRSLSSLLSSGVPLIRSLEITSGTVSSFYFKQALAGASKGVERGEKLFISFKPYQNIFPYGALEMIEIGEETGKTSLILEKLAEFYEEEVSNIAESLSTIIEPVLIVIIALIVGVFAVSIIGPMYSSLNSI